MAFCKRLFVGSTSGSTPSARGSPLDPLGAMTGKLLSYTLYSYYRTRHHIQFLLLLYRGWGVLAIFVNIFTSVSEKVVFEVLCFSYKGNNKITELQTIFQRESQNS